MIYEYAINPEFIIMLACMYARDSEIGSMIRMFLDNFGIHEGRLASRYPKNWETLVWETYLKKNSSKPQTIDDNKRFEDEKYYLTELIQKLGVHMIERENYIWNDMISWFENVAKENERVSFKAIITINSLSNQSNVISLGEMVESNPVWKIERGRKVNRNAKDMAIAVAPMLSKCQRVFFIDPHFGPEVKRYRDTLREFFYAIITNRPCPIPKQLEVQTSDKSEKEFFKKQCETYMPKIIPKPLKVNFKRWVVKTDGEQFHNRYILTDIGGVVFLTGLDRGRHESQSDDVMLLDSEQYFLRYSDYITNPAFDLDMEIEIIGTGL